MTRSHLSPALGCAIALENTAFSRVFLACLSNSSRSRATPSSANTSSASSASVVSSVRSKFPFPPENTIRAVGYWRASLIAARTRSISPPRITIPSGEAPLLVQAGNRVSIARIKRFPMGRNPQMAKPATQTARSFCPKGRYRLGIRISPAMPIAIRKLDGVNRAPSVFDTMKNNLPTPKCRSMPSLYMMHRLVPRRDPSSRGMPWRPRAAVRSAC